MDNSELTQVSTGENNSAENQASAAQTEQQSKSGADVKTKFCKHCGGKIPEDAVVCNLCGRQVEELKSSANQPNIVINNDNNNANVNANVNKNTVGAGVPVGRPKNKWVSVALCCIFGIFGAHKFYEGQIGTGILYLCTGGLCGVGIIIDLIKLLNKPNPYYV